MTPLWQALFIPILKVEKLRFKEVKWLGQDHIHVKGQIWVTHLNLLALAPDHFYPPRLSLMWITKIRPYSLSEPWDSNPLKNLKVELCYMLSWFQKMDAKEKKGINEGQSCHRVVVEKERDRDLNKQNKGRASWSAFWAVDKKQYGLPF